jgi:hypothetical protein
MGGSGEVGAPAWCVSVAAGEAGDWLVALLSAAGAAVGVGLLAAGAWVAVGAAGAGDAAWLWAGAAAGVHAAGA